MSDGPSGKPAPRTMAHMVTRTGRRGLIRVWPCSTSGWGLPGEPYHPDVCRRQGRGWRGGVIAAMRASGSSSGFARYSQTNLRKVHSLFLHLFVHSFIRSFIRVLSQAPSCTLRRSYLIESWQPPCGGATLLIPALQTKKQAEGGEVSKVTELARGGAGIGIQVYTDSGSIFLSFWFSNLAAHQNCLENRFLDRRCQIFSFSFLFPEPEPLDPPWGHAPTPASPSWLALLWGRSSAVLRESPAGSHLALCTCPSRILCCRPFL